MHIAQDVVRRFAHYAQLAFSRGCDQMGCSKNDQQNQPFHGWFPA